MAGGGIQDRFTALLRKRRFRTLARAALRAGGDAPAENGDEDGRQHDFSPSLHHELLLEWLPSSFSRGAVFFSPRAASIEGRRGHRIAPISLLRLAGPVWGHRLY